MRKSLKAHETDQLWRDSDKMISPFGKRSRVWKGLGKIKATYYWSGVLEYSNDNGEPGVFALAPKCWEIEPGVPRDELFKDDV